LLKLNEEQFARKVPDKLVAPSQKGGEDIFMTASAVSAFTGEHIDEKNYGVIEFRWASGNCTAVNCEILITSIVTVGHAPTAIDDKNIFFVARRGVSAVSLFAVISAALYIRADANVTGCVAQSRTNDIRSAKVERIIKMRFKNMGLTTIILAGFERGIS